MVFSQTSHKTQNMLKVVEIDHLKSRKSLQEERAAASPGAPDAVSEVILKSEPLYENTMIQDMDFEFFQNLPTFITEQSLSSDPMRKIENEALHTDTLHTPLSPHAWDTFDTNPPSVQASLYNNIPNDPHSPTGDGFTSFDAKFLGKNESQIQFPEQFLYINSLPIVMGDLASAVGERDASPTEPASWVHTHNTDYTKQNTLDTLPLIHDEDSQDWRIMPSVVPTEVENNYTVIEEYILNENGVKGELLEDLRGERDRGLTLDVSGAPGWHDEVSTPDVLRAVEQLEKQTFPLAASTPIETWLQDDTGFMGTEDIPGTTLLDYEPITPKSESHHIESEIEDVKSPPQKRRRRRPSEESDETYTPYSEVTTRSYRRRKSNVSLIEKIRALEGSQQLPKARRGRPPKRRESNVSSVASVDDNASSISTQEVKYRELRDKNNEASKRSRMNRKLKELQMEQYADELEEKNKRLKVKADILEDMTKRLKNALMTAILQK